MGFWAGIKHALNSTLGTEDFIPLDKLIKGQRTLAASDSSIAVISGSKSCKNGYVFPERFIARTKGVVRVIAKGTPSNSSGKDGYIYIYRDGAEVGTMAFPFGENVQVSADVSVNKGNELSFIVKVSSLDCDYVRIGAQIVDGSLFEVNSVS